MPDRTMGPMPCCVDVTERSYSPEFVRRAVPKGFQAALCCGDCFRYRYRGYGATHLAEYRY